MSHSMRRDIPLPYEETLSRVPAALKAEGFGVLTEIDVKKTLHEKIGAEFRPYKILGACNPQLAHRALTGAIDVGVLLPCNVVVYEGDQPGCSVVLAVDPMATIGSTRPELQPIAAEVRERLGRVLDALARDAGTK